MLIVDYAREQGALHGWSVATRSQHSATRIYWCLTAVIIVIKTERLFTKAISFFP